MSPNAPKTPIRGVRVPTPLWLRAQDLARERGDNLSEVMREALERYVALHGGSGDCGKSSCVTCS